ncbi:glycosyltransferase family 39 protein [Coniophora puteana RWD-64-598 SS2]|uniref:Dolichyl-phosphate-mannose--protein mannosyltransferase n=1 Tax=Coniophora puteana (strain RWD-64-598) TaxID=741705 RepID=A0A5M3MSR0_CONPW|nr:glycosyltransferase family 39 protein [Coniophora puteana RWD-64-598 SS2]EIW81774.1 glycosyltransferase family 39 protein [Coniophora puteana RWD-64-598 SS2]
MSGNVRARRPASPPPGYGYPAPHKYPPASHGYSDADERREAAARGMGPTRAKAAAANLPGGLNITPGEWKLLVVILLVACSVRLFRLSKPDSVVFDEVHFGKFAGWYIKTRYFVDVHPPLAKMLITLAGWIFGFNGDFDFKEIAKPFENVPYVAMRLVPAMLGVATVPISYLTLRALDCRATTSLLAALFITFENGLVTQSRYILLDSPLVFFTALTALCFVVFSNEDRREPFSDRWWVWLAFTGLSLGAVVSCKWVGLFTIATVGVCTVLQLWFLLGDLRVTPRMWMRHFAARAICLIGIPIVFYMFMFSIHFAILANPGDGDSFMSSEFRSTLGRGMRDTYADVALGSEITLKHANTDGGYLHSHPHNYPIGSEQQQVTLYPHQDFNNVWRVLNATVDDDPQYDWANDPLEYIRDGARIKLRHIATDKALHSHEVRPPVSDVDFQNEVSGYGMAGWSGDLNDDWVVDIDHGSRGDRESGERVKALKTYFRLRHLMTGCVLFSHKVKLPEWGFEQQEVTCNKQAAKPNTLWYIETVAKHPQLHDDAEMVNYEKPGFIAKFWELQKVMWKTNAGLTARHAYDSRPATWPRLRRGINFWVKDGRQVYLIGNPFIWYMSTLSVLGYVAARGFLILRAKRGYRDFDNSKAMKYDAVLGFLFLGWAMHYLPFFLMGRQLFLHHYFPALYFAVLLTCGVFDLCTATFRPRVRLQIAAVLALVAIVVFARYSALAYGSEWTRGKCEAAKLGKGWDFDCSTFPHAYDQYKTAGATPHDSAAQATVGGEYGGRAPVAVNEPVAGAGGDAANQAGQGQANQAGAESSAAPALGAPEPGRDIFEEHPQKAMASKSVAADEAAAREREREKEDEEREKEREVSVVVQTPVVTVVSKAEEKVVVDEKKKETPVGFEGDEKTEEEEEKESEETTTGTDKEPEAETEAEVEVEKTYKKPAGPLGHEEQIADQIAQELYPEALDDE